MVWKTHNTICYGILLYDYVCTLTAFRHISHLLLLHHAKRQHFSVLRAGTFVPWPCTDCTVPNICLFCRAASVYVCWLACIRRNFGFIFAFRKENRKPACDKFKPVFTSWKQNRFNIFRAIAFVLLSLIFCLLFLILKQNNFLGNHYINPSVDCCLSAGLCLFCDVIWAHVTAQCSFRFRK